MATKNEKALAQAICGLTDLLSLLKPQLAELWDAECDKATSSDGVIPEKLATMCDYFGNDNPIRKLAEDILSQEIDEPAAKKSGMTKDERYWYTGLEALDMSLEQRKEIGVCEFTIRKGKDSTENVLRIYWDPSLEWIMQPNEDATEFTACAKRKFPGRAFARSFLKELADAEMKEPGAFAKKYYPEKPKAFVRRK